jgi:adenylate cyclase
VEGETYLALPFPLGAADAPLLAVILQSRDLAFRPYRSLQWTLLGVGFAGILAAAWYSTRFSRSITAPVDKLVEGTERVAAGNFDVPVEVQSGDEIAHLADSFNSMLQGLRERVAIGKFVSQSTIKAIRKEHAVQAAGQRLELTVFFSDIRGFTEMTERRPPEDVVMILNQCLSLQADIVKKYRGDVDKFVGDCVVAHFYDQASPMDAIRCAIEIEKSLDEFNARLPEADRIDVGIGLVTGEVVLGSIGSADRRDFTAVGSNVNLASRLCSMAGAGEILLAESCYQRVQGQVAAERLAPLTVKGFRQPIPVYRINATARTTA